MFTHKLESAGGLQFKLRFQKCSSQGHRQSRHFKSGSVLKKVLDKDVETTVHTGSDMPYGHLIAATVMTTVYAPVPLP